MKTNHNNFLNLSFNLARINLGKTKANPSVGCVVVKKDSVISSGYTSIKGRPHAEFNALNKKINFIGSDFYVTMEPCTHYGLTPPCTDLIIKKGIKRVFYSFYDVDKRTANKAKYELEKKRIKVLKRKNKIFYDFYNSYFKNKEKQPFVDAKIAVSQDYLTIKKKNKWITNYLSRSRAHLIRSEYDAIMSTSKTINSDNALLNCRLKGFDNTKPDLLIIDLHLSLKKKLNLLKGKSKRKIFIITSVLKSKKINFFKKKGIKIIFIKFLDNKSDFIKLFKTLKNYGFNRILVESGLTFLNRLLKDKLISNLYLFKSSEKLGKRGKNNASSINLKTFKLDNKIKVNLDNDNLYKIRFR